MLVEKNVGPIIFLHWMTSRSFSGISINLKWVQAWPTELTGLSSFHHHIQPLLSGGSIASTYIWLCSLLEFSPFSLRRSRLWLPQRSFCSMDFWIKPSRLSCGFQSNWIHGIDPHMWPRCTFSFFVGITIKGGKSVNKL